MIKEFTTRLFSCSFVLNAYLGIILVLSLTSCSEGERKSSNSDQIITLSLPTLSLKTRAAVEDILGKGIKTRVWRDKRAGCTSCPVYTYRKDSIEIIYIKDMADRITVNHLSKYPFNESIIESMGLPAKRPDFANDNVLRWKNYEGMREITAFSTTTGTVDYVLVQAKAE